MNYLLLIVIISFSIIHFLEVSGFVARVSGLKKGYTSFAYALQNSVYVFTRFFSMLLLPILGFLVDIKVPKDKYLLTIHLSLFFASSLSMFVFLIRVKVEAYFGGVIESYQKKGNMFYSLIYGWSKYHSLIAIDKSFPEIDKKIFLLSGVIFMIYSLSIFVFFYMAIIFHEYRGFLTQLSGITNAFATVLLTFFIEPKISIVMDSNKSQAVNKLYSLLLGRVLFVGFFSQLLLSILWFM